MPYWFIIAIAALILLVLLFISARMAQLRGRSSGKTIPDKHPNIYESRRTQPDNKKIPRHRKLNKVDFKKILGEMLSEDEQMLVTMHHFDEMTLAEIAFITGKTESEVYETYRKIRGKIEKIKNEDFSG